MATDPIRLRVLKALTTYLGGIAIVDGYKTDLADRVFRGRVVFGDSDSIPMLSILEAPVPPEQLRSSRENLNQGGDWDLLIQGFAEDDKANPTDPAHVLAADVNQRLTLLRKDVRSRNILGQGRTIIGTTTGLPVVRPPDEVSSKAYFWMPFTIEMVEDPTEPYAD